MPRLNNCVRLEIPRDPAVVANENFSNKKGRMKKAHIVCSLVFLLICSMSADAQKDWRAIKKHNTKMYTYRGRASRFPKAFTYNALAVSLNTLNYYGDLAPRPGAISTNLSLSKPSVGISFSHRYGPRYALTGSFMYGTIEGSDQKSADRYDTSNGMYRYQRNLSFRNRIKELSIVATFDLFENTMSYLHRVRWTPYVYAGIAVFHHNPQAIAPAFQVDGKTPLKEAGQWIDLRRIGTEGQHAQLNADDANSGIKDYSLIQIAIPFGVGFRYRLNELMDLSCEFGVRYLFTDYIDDVSKNYVDLGVFGTNELAKAMSYRTFELSQFSPGSTNPNLTTYTGRDGKQYTVLYGYGSEYNVNGVTNKRGNPTDKDIYTVFSVKVSYIVNRNIHKAKER